MAKKDTKTDMRLILRLFSCHETDTYYYLIIWYTYRSENDKTEIYFGSGARTGRRCTLRR